MGNMRRALKIAGGLLGLFTMGLMAVLMYGFVQEKKKFQRMSEHYMETV